MAVSSKDLEPICSTGFLQGILLCGIKVKNEKFLVENCFKSKIIAIFVVTFINR